MSRYAALLIGPLGIGLLVACLNGDDVVTVEMRGEPPVARITVVDTELDGRRIGLHLEEEAAWPPLVDLEVFEGFHPRMSHEEARIEVGPPDESRGSVRIYKRPLGRVEVALVRDSSGDDVFEQWQLRARPNRDRVEDVFEPELAQQISPLLRRRSVVVLLHPNVYEPVLRVTLTDKRVKSITWYRE